MKVLVAALAAVIALTFAACQHVEPEVIVLDEPTGEGTPAVGECVDHDIYPEPEGTMVGSFQAVAVGGTWPCDKPWIIARTTYGDEKPGTGACADVYINADGEALADGETGVYNFTAENEPNFGVYTDCLTDGIDQELVDAIQMGDCSWGGHGRLESGYELGSPDLVGHDVDLIRLEVCSVSITASTQDGLDGYKREVVTVWEFWDL